MAGIRQHILPRFLLKGFASRVDGENVFSIYFRRGTPPREINTLNIGVERKFYEAEDGRSVDDEITDFERPMAALLDRLRRLPSGTRLDGEPEVPSFVAHLVTRTRHLRDSFASMGDYALEQMWRHLADPVNQVRLVLRRPEIMEDALKKALNEARIPPMLRPVLRSQIEAMLPMYMKQWAAGGNPEMTAMIGSVFGQVQARLPSITRNSHIQVLSNSITPQPRLDWYRSLNWFVLHSEIPQILGDVGAVFEMGGEGRFKGLDALDEDVRAAYLPIASHVLLVGTPEPTLPGVEFERIRTATATVSRDFFVAGGETPEISALHGRLGEQCDPLTPEEMDALFEEALKDGL